MNRTDSNAESCMTIHMAYLSCSPGVYIRALFLACRNAALGLGDSNDRTHPDHVVIFKKDAPLPATRTLEERFQPVKVRGVSMSKLHTGRRYHVGALGLIQRIGSDSYRRAA